MAKRVKKTAAKEIVKIMPEVKPHTWTDGGEKVLILKRINRADRISSRGFTYGPQGSRTECTDWNTDPKCGGGLHGWPWGMGIGEGSDYDIIGDEWLVLAARIEEIIGELEGGWKCKCKSADIAYSGPFAGAWAMVNSGRHRLIEAMSKIDAGEISAGDYSKAASSGDYSKAASSGDSSTAASSGNYSTAASSGNYSKAASSGNYSTAASSGNYSKAASSGDSSTAASSGNSSTAASSGNYSTAASSGDYSKAASSGNYSTAASSGNYSTAASSGNSSKAASSGNSSTAASSGNYSKAASSGDYSKAASSGNSSKVSQEGKSGIAASIGHGGEVSADEKGLLIACYWDEKESRYRACVGHVGEDGIEAKTKYKVENGKLVKVKTP